MKLPNVTLLGIDCVNVERLQAALDISRKDIEFAQVKLLTSLPTSDSRSVKIPHIGSVEEYSRFCIEELHKYVDTDFVLLVQYDGFILNPEKWSDEFLKYDYIGAPWLVRKWSVRDFGFPKEMLGKLMVGNGGFSIRSKKLLEASAQLAREGRIPKFHPEDTALCVWHKKDLEKEGVRFASPELAKKFSLEGEYFTYDEQFGFHSFEWTNVDGWMRAHPEHLFINAEYKKARIGHFQYRLMSSRDKALNDAEDAFKAIAIEAHVFGSVARRDSDAYSDLDIWFTFKDEDIKDVLKKRLEYYSKIGEIVHVCEPPQNSPVGGIHSAVIYRTYKGLLAVDYYLCPLSSSFLTEESKKMFGDIILSKGALSLNPRKVAVDASYRIDFVIMMAFISIKNLARGESDALGMLSKEYGYLAERYDINVGPLVDRKNTFSALKEVIANLKKVSNEKQTKALSEIEIFADQVEDSKK